MWYITGLVFLLGNVFAAPLNAPLNGDVSYIDLSGGAEEAAITAAGPWANFEGPKADDKTVYVVNSMDDVSSHKGIVNTESRFLAKNTYESIYWDAKAGTWVKHTYDMDLMSEEREISLEACVDNHMGGDKASLSRSVSYSVSGALGGSASFSLALAGLDLKYLFDLTNSEKELAVSVSYKTSASCDVPKGKFGRLYSVLTVVTNKPYTKTNMRFNGTKFVATGPAEVVDESVEFITSDMPKVVCHIDSKPC